MHLDLPNLLAVMVVALVGGRVAGRLGYPTVLGELLVGILLGPAVLGWLEASAALSVLAELGVLLMMLYIGMSVDPQELKRASWGGLLVAFGGFFGPAALCFGLARWWGEAVGTAVFMGVAAGVTAIAVNGRILVDLDLMETRIAHVLMAGALVTDVLCLVGLTAVLSGDRGTLRWEEVVATALQAVAFFAAIGVVGLWALPRLGGPARRWAERARTAGLSLALIVAVGVAAIAEGVGLHGLIGAFFAGMFLREEALGRDFAAQLRRVVHDASIGFLAPIFFVTSGFLVSVEAVGTQPLELVAFIALASVGKVAGTALAYLATGNGWREGLVLGLAMNGRGAVEIIVAGVALKAGIIDDRLFSMLVLMAMVTTATVPPLLRVGVAWLRARGELASGRDGRSGVVIVGAGPTALALARALGPGDLCVVDSAADHCEAARRAGFDALQGNALDPAVLEAAGCSHAQSVVAVTSNSSINALVASLARHRFGVPVVFAASGDAESGLRHMGASKLFGRVVQLSDWDRRVASGEVDATVVSDALAPDTLPLVVLGGERPLVYDALQALEPGRQVLALRAR